VASLLANRETQACQRGYIRVPPFTLLLEPGQFVRHPQRPDWGVGQVQSVIDGRVTVNFEHAGKVLVNARVVSLEVLHGVPGVTGA
jgi:transcription elongation factor GreA-like protein